MNLKRWMHCVVTSALAAGSMGSAVAADSSGGPPSAEFKKLDVNHDGYLSREEVRKIRGFEKAFKEADENRDGRLDVDEFVKAQAIHDRVRVGQYLDDSVITTKVKAALLRDRTLSVLGVSVETYKGTVLLSGFVDSEEEVRRATEIAASVDGVVNVKNGLAVRS
jgi:hyperosmotically inducible protein